MIMQMYQKVLKTSKNACQVQSVECVSNIMSILSVTLLAIYGAVCIKLAHIAYDDCENAGTLPYHHNEIRTMTHQLSFMVSSGTMVWVVCLPTLSWYGPYIQSKK